MKFTLQTLGLLALAMLHSFGVSAQVLFSENFSGGSLPATWTNADASTNGVLWEFCANPTAGCVDLYGRPPFAAADAANGFAIHDSDAAGELASNHVSRLTTPATNCSSAAQVFVTFESYIGVFLHSADDLARLRVSNDGINWTSFQIFTGLTGNTAATRFSDNPEVSVINVSTVAAGKSTVFVQWEWEGNYDYWWMLDNIVVTTEDPSPRNDIELSDFFYPASSYATPAAQIATDTFGFYGLVSNNGAAAATNVKLTAKVVSIGQNGQVSGVLFETSNTINTLPTGYQDSLIVLDEQFAPELGQGLYRVIYTVSSDSIDQRPADNENFDNFEVTDLIYSKEVGATGGLRPGSGGDYGVANLYSLSSASLESYKASGIEFTCATNAANPLQDIVVAGYLFKVNEDVAADFSNFDDADYFSASLEWVGTGDFDFPAGAANYALQSFELADVATGEAGVPLQAGARYFASIFYSGTSNVAFQAFADRINYKFVSTPVYTSAWFLGGFGEEDAAVIRLYLELSSTTDEKPLPENTLSVFPNPASDWVNLKVDFKAPTDATVTIAELNGRVVTHEDHQGLTSETLALQLPPLPAGTYLARIATKAGTQTRKFVVVK